jgi:hypothetical protein
MNGKSFPDPKQLGIKSAGTLAAGTTGGRLGKAPVDSHKGLMDKGKYNESCANGYDIPTADHDARPETRMSRK